MGDWSHLPKDLLLLIAKCLETHFDILHFRSVCPTWRASVPLSLRSTSFSSPVPLRIDENGNKLLLFKRTICLLEFISEPNQTTPRFLLAMLEEDEFGKKHIINPITRVKLKPVQYPKVLDMSKLRVQELGLECVVGSTDPEGKVSDFVEKVAYMNLNPDDDHGFTVLAKDYDLEDLYLFKSGDEKVSTIEGEAFFDLCVDFVESNSKFYAIDILRTTICVEPCFVASTLVAEASPPTTLFTSFLVQSFGKTLLVERSAIGCEVFQLNEERKRWVRLESLGEVILFLGNFSSFAVSVVQGVEGNCIVFNSKAGFAIGKSFI